MHVNGMSLNGRTTDLRRYARWEYGTQDAAWRILAEAQAARRTF